jgi:mono/diheme cytochrome c family protein
MKKALIAMLFASAFLCQTSFAADSAGKTLVDQNCQACHDNGIFTRSNSIIHSYPELQARVEFCDGAAKTHFTDEQINQVVEYLNDTFYKFPKP